MARKRPRKEAFHGNELDQLSLIFRARDASRTGWAKKSGLEVDLGRHFSIQNGPKMTPKVQVRSARLSGRHKSRRSGRLDVFVQ